MKLLAECLPFPMIQPFWRLKLLLINNVVNFLTITVPKDPDAGTKIELQELHSSATSTGDQITEPRSTGSWLLCFFFFFNNKKSLQKKK